MIDQNQIVSLYKNIIYFTKKYVFLVITCVLLIGVYSLYKYKYSVPLYNANVSIYTNQIEPLIIKNVMDPIVENSLTRNTKAISQILDIPSEKASNIQSITYKFNEDRYRKEFLPFASIDIQTTDFEYIDSVIIQILNNINKSPFVNEYYKNELAQRNNILAQIDIDIKSIHSNIEQLNNRKIIDLGNLYLTLYTLQKDKQKLLKEINNLDSMVITSTSIVKFKENKSLTLSLIIAIIGGIALSVILILLTEFIRIGKSNS